MIHLALPPETTSPLTAPPPHPTTADTAAEKQEIINFCKSKILPDAKASSLLQYDVKSPTRVLAAALFYKIERKYFDQRTTRADISTMFRITTAQLTKAVTGVDYRSGPHSTTKKKAPCAESTSTTQPAQPQSASSSNQSNVSGQTKRKHDAVATTSHPPKKKQKVALPSAQKEETSKADDTLTTESSDSSPLPEVNL